MSGLKQLRNRVKSIKSTQKTTKAMQVVSAAKLNKLKDQAARVNNFSHILASLMNNITHGDGVLDLPSKDRHFFSKSLLELPHLLIVMTSERGLCGGFNSSVLKQVKTDLFQYRQKGKKIKLIIIGKKGYEALRHDHADIIEGYYNLSNDYESVAAQVKQKVISLVEQQKIGGCFMYYNRFKNAMTQIVTTEQVLPAVDQQKSEAEDRVNVDTEGENLVRSIIDLYIHGEVNYALLQSRASEEGARMTAMDNSTKNASELVDKLTLKLNRSRQAMITTELTEIISGAEAV
ncbi:MAG: hypothetical protein DGJ47_000319 [Rickettsiaceae bacterium]